MVAGDLEKMRTIVDNLMSNAIKYSPRSGAIEIALVERDGFAVLDVADHGPGMSADERERVFDSFYSGKAPVDGKVKGIGPRALPSRANTRSRRRAASRCWTGPTAGAACASAYGCRWPSGAATLLAERAAAAAPATVVGGRE